MLTQSKYFKLKIVLPKEFVEKIKEVLGENGAGKIGNYDYCTYVYPVSGSFRPLAGANPAIGKIGKIEHVDEMVVEVICHEDDLLRVVEAVRMAHPYEEPMIDIIPRLELK